MATINVTPLNNGIVLGGGELISGILPIGTSGSYLYYTSLGNIYFQSNPTTPAVLLLAAGFAITCAEVFYDGTSWLGGNNGNYVFGVVTLDLTDPSAPTQTNTLTIQTSPATQHYSAIAFDWVAYAFTIGDSTGNLYTADVSTGAVTLLRTLTAPALPALSTLVISRIVYDVNIDAYLICATSSANTTVAAPGNYSIIYSGKLSDPSFSTHEITGEHIWLGAIGVLDNPLAKATDVPPKPKVTKYVVAGGEAVIYTSDDGITWVKTPYVDQAVTINSLCFSSWAFVAGLLYGIILVSTDGVVWGSAFDAQIASDVINIKAIS